MIYKVKRGIFFVIIATAIILIGLIAFVANTSETLIADSSALAIKVSNDSMLYDVENIMSYYVDSLKNEDTLIHRHYIQETSPDKEVNCLSCHDIDTLRKLYLLCDAEAVNEAKDNMSDTINELCFVCHGSYLELIQLTKDSMALMDSDGTVINPHDTMLGEAACNYCHSIHDATDSAAIALAKCYTCHLSHTFYG